MSWSLCAYGVAAVLSLGVSASIWGIPLQLTDFTTYLIDMAQLSTWELMVDRFQSRANFRPFFYLQMKALFEWSNGSYFLAFKAAYIVQLFATMLLTVRLLDVRSAAGFVASIVVVVMLLGLHTTRDVLREGPMILPLCFALAMTVAAAARSTWWRDICAVLLLAVATLTVELGLLLLVIYVVGRLVGWRGVSARAIVACSVLVLVYFGYRFTVLNPGGADLEFRWTGVGFLPREPEELMEMFRGRMPVLYAYNMASSILTVLFSEPRSGVWTVVAGMVRDDVGSGPWLSVISSLATTGCLAWFVWMRLPDWRRRTFTGQDGFVLIAAAVLIANAAISHRYTRDVIMYPAGMLYALAAYPALHAALVRLSALSRLRRSVAVALLLTISVTWSLRAAEMFYALRTTAYDKRNDWAEAVEILERRQALRRDDQRVIVLQLRREALSMSTPNPRLAQPWLDRWMDPLY
jgi:hypothetical protein